MAEFCSKTKATNWLVLDEVFALLATGDSAKKGARPYAKYLAFLSEGTALEVKHFYARKNLLSVLGNDKFKNSAKSKTAPAKPRGIGKGKLARLRPSIKKVVTEVAKHFKVSGESIYQAARGPGSKKCSTLDSHASLPGTPCSNIAGYC